MSAHLLKKSQIQMMETVMVLIIFFFILVIGLVFYANVQIGAAKEDLKKYNELKAIENMQKLLFLPELQCGGGDEVSTCIDMLKLRALANVMANGTNRIYYSDELGNSLVEIQEVYPGNESLTLYNKTTKGTASLFQYHYGIL